MDFNTLNSESFAPVSPVQSASLARSFMARVFSWMFLALTITAVTSFIWAASPSLLAYLIDITTGKMTILGWIIMFAPLGFVLLMSLGFAKLPAPLMILLFLVYSVLMGMSMSFIFLIYSIASIGITFSIAAGTFGVMAILGYFTKTDLTRFGTFLYMALIGIVIAMLVNFFLKSDSLGYVVSIIGVLVFTGLTAYDVQKLKNIGSNPALGGNMHTKMAVFGALTLYLDFINLFLFLLRIFGGRK